MVNHLVILALPPIYSDDEPMRLPDQMYMINLCIFNQEYMFTPEKIAKYNPKVISLYSFRDHHSATQFLSQNYWMMIYH